MSVEITSIRGLTNLTNLTRLEIDNHAIDGTLDVSGLSNLTNLDASDNNLLGSTGIKTLNVTGCTSLEFLYMDDNDFSAGFPDLSDCTSLEYIDFDQCGIVGSVDLSNLPNLQGFDLSGNTDITEVIISSEQPLGNGGTILNLTSCTSLTQTSLDNILQQLSSGSVSTGVINFGSSAIPSLNGGLPALKVLVADRGWDFSSSEYAQAANTTFRFATSGEACTALANNETGNQFIYAETSIQVGNRIFNDNLLIYPMEDGYFGNFDDGLWYQIGNGNGTIIASGSCG